MNETANGRAGLGLDGVVKSFKQADRELEVLCGVDIAIAPGELTALVGPSGAGKSTLLHIAGLLERPDEGEIRIAGTACSRLPDGERTRIRRNKIGFVYQYHHLLPEFSALENIIVPQMIAGVGRRQARERGRELLDMVALGQRAGHRPVEGMIHQPQGASPRFLRARAFSHENRTLARGG